MRKVLLILSLILGGCVAPVDIIHKDTAIVGQRIDAAKTSVNAADSKVITVAAASDTTPASKSLLVSAHTDLGNASKSLDAAREPLPQIDKAADKQQAAYNSLYNSWGARLERLLRRLFWWLLGGAVVLGILSVVLGSTPFGAPILGGFVALLGHGMGAILTVGIPHVFAALVAFVHRIAALFKAKPPAPSSSSGAA